MEFDKLKMEIASWQGHEGKRMVTKNGFDIIDCCQCGFIHIIPIPTEKELEKIYRHNYYTQEKPLYLERHRADLDWWNMVYAERFEIMEQYLDASRRRLLDVGSGPGFFLLNGQKRGWQVKGIEPSKKAVEHSRGLGVEVENGFFSKQSASSLGKFDAINLSEVLEHIPNPEALLSLVYGQLDNNGMVCISVPNDFNPFQNALYNYLDFKPWWIAPPHHINYFTFESIQKLIERCGFEVVHKEATFPIDMFLLMGENYIDNDELGRICHQRRMTFELNLINAGMGYVKKKLFKDFANSGFGREVVLFALKKF
jgi:SAM-dependent methyltransferase